MRSRGCSRKPQVCVGGGAPLLFRDPTRTRGRVVKGQVSTAGVCSPGPAVCILLSGQVSADQVMLSHSPLRMFTQYHEKCVLVSGQGPVTEVARNLGFQKVVTIERLREAYPLLDVVDHHRRPRDQVRVCCGGTSGREGPSTWVGTALVTVLGVGGEAVVTVLGVGGEAVVMVLGVRGPAPHVALRFGHGTFLVCLEHIYQKVTGRELKYEALIGKPSLVTYNYAELLVRQQAEARGWTEPVVRLYAIGDNPMADIYGANLYNRYLQGALEAQLKGARLAEAQGAPPEAAGGPEALGRCLAECCVSVLVCTGVYGGGGGGGGQRDLPQDPRQSVTERVFHGHRDFRFDPSLVEPALVARDVDEAVELVFGQEGWPLA
nr:PREDICTED: cat eye syndrome critical region protein 5-like [Lepisosteus oculatus]